MHKLASASMLALLLVAACGEDEDGGGGASKPANPGAVGAGAAPGGAAANPNAPKAASLVTLMHVEERVNCPVPKKVEDLPPPDDRCDPALPTPCRDKAKPYCLVVPAAQGAAYCLPCTERDNIRHAFKDRDFAPEQNRDPFQSFVLAPVGLGANDKPVADANPAVRCNDQNSFLVGYSYTDLKLVGIVTQGTLRKGLVTGGRSNAIVRKNDCLGKEKALVAEVGDGYVDVITQVDPNVAGSRPVKFTLLLRQNTLALGAPDAIPTDRPAIEGPGTVPSPSGTNIPSPPPQRQPAQPQQGSTTRIEIPSPQPQPSQGPTAPPTQLNP